MFCKGINIKTCSKCKQRKHLSDFYNNARAKNKKTSRCKECFKEYQNGRKNEKKKYDKKYCQKNEKKIKSKKREYRIKNKEKLNRQSNEYYQRNRIKILSKSRKKSKKQICIYCNKEFYNKKTSKYCSKCCCTKYWFENNKEYAKEWRIKNPDKVKAKEKRYRKKHPEKRKEESRKYREKHREEIKVRRSEWLKIPRNKLSNRMRGAIWRSIRDKNHRKWESLVNYSINDLINYFKNKYNFDINLCLTEAFHIDHIIPISVYSFKSYSDEEFKKCWSLRNLRPVHEKENRSKANKLDFNLIEKYNIQDLLPPDLLFEVV